MLKARQQLKFICPFILNTKKFFHIHRATKIGVIRADVQPSPLRDKQNGGHDNFRKNGLKPKKQKYFWRLY